MRAKLGIARLCIKDGHAKHREQAHRHKRQEHRARASDINNESAQATRRNLAKRNMYIPDIAVPHACVEILLQTTTLHALQARAHHNTAMYGPSNAETQSRRKYGKRAPRPGPVLRPDVPQLLSRQRRLCLRDAEDLLEIGQVLTKHMQLMPLFVALVESVADGLKNTRDRKIDFPMDVPRAPCFRILLRHATDVDQTRVLSRLQ